MDEDKEEGRASVVDAVVCKGDCPKWTRDRATAPPAAAEAAFTEAVSKEVGVALAERFVDDDVAREDDVAAPAARAIAMIGLMGSPLLPTLLVCEDENPLLPLFPPLSPFPAELLVALS